MRQTQMLTKYLSQGLAFLLTAILLAACGSNSNTAGGTGGRPITVQVLDAGGELKLVQHILQNYQKAHPSKVIFKFLPSATAPDVPGKIKAQQGAHRQDISLVLGGYDIVSSGTAQGLWERLFPDHSSNFPNLDSNYLPGAKQYNDLAQGYAVSVAYTPSGPLFEYDPSKVANPPQTIEQLRTWIKANPGKFEYARPRNSGPGRTLLMGLPYLLGDKDPKDPINGWNKTWAFLKDIDSAITYYPSRTGLTMTEIGNGTRSMIASTMGWDINPRVLGQVPASDKTFLLQKTTFVADDQFMLMPKGLDNAHQSLILDIMSWTLRPDQQAYEYDSGYFYPGPSVKDVALSMAPDTSQSMLKTYGRPEYDSMAQNVPIVMPLSTTALNAAFDKWDKDIGSAKLKS